MKQNRLLITVLAAALLLSGCSNTNSSSSTPSENSEVSSTVETPTAETSAPAEEIPAEDGSVYIDFSNGENTLFERSDGWSNGSMFNCTWRKGNVTFADDVLKLSIDHDITPALVPYSGGEYRSKDFYGFGRYEVSMKAIKNDGVVSSFFTYTGPSDNNPWDEIDVEILGKDTTKVQFNYFTNGSGGHEYMHDLGFDASEDFHTYAFEWYADKIVWYVDDVEVHSADANIPSVAGKIMMNTWPGTGVDGWLNAFDESSLPITAEYEWVRFTPFDE